VVNFSFVFPILLAQRSAIFIPKLFTTDFQLVSLKSTVEKGNKNKQADKRMEEERRNGPFFTPIFIPYFKPPIFNAIPSVENTWRNKMGE